MSKALDKDETFKNFNSSLEWASDKFKLVLNNELFHRNHIQTPKSVPETKIEIQQPTINKQDVIVNDYFESASQMSQSYHRFYKLPCNTPMFMAGGRTCNDWFFVIENALDTGGIPDDIIRLRVRIRLRRVSSFLSRKTVIKMMTAFMTI